MEQQNIEFIRSHCHIMNLTDDEIKLTLRMMELTKQFSWSDIYKKSPEVNALSNEDKFLLLLWKMDREDNLVRSKMLIHYFGGSVYQWRKIGRKHPLTDVATAFSESSSGYYGRGWVIAPHIHSLMKYLNTPIDKL